MERIATNVNIEIVKGCANTDCLSWNTTCQHFGPIKRMPIYVLEVILRELSKYDISNIALYGRGDALEHNDINQCFALVKSILPAVTTFLNVDGHSMKKHEIPLCDYLNVCHKEEITHPPFSSISHIPKVTHSFLVRKITHKLLDEIDEYIGETIQLNNKNLYAIGSLWNIEFGIMPPIGTFTPLESEDGIEITIPQNPLKYPRRKVYIDINGIVRKCLFSDKKYKDINALLSIDGNNCNCEGCGMDVFTYKINLKGGDGIEKI
jgi:hypothetical protein